jgi:hypothetical protein
MKNSEPKQPLSGMGSGLFINGVPKKPSDVKNLNATSIAKSSMLMEYV